MKRFNLLSVAVVLVLLVTTVSCTTMTGMQDDYYSQAPARRVYVDDPYRGTVVLERDPRTGRYYEVSTYGGYGADPYYNNRVHRGGYYGNRGNVYRNNRNYYPNRNQQTTPPRQPQQPQPQSPQEKQNREDARKKVLGN